MIFKGIVQQGGNGFVLTSAISEDKGADAQQVRYVRDCGALSDVRSVKLDSVG
jgi:hypothetical protein